MKTSQNKSPSLWLFVALSFERNALIFRPCLFLVRYQDRTQAQARFNLKPCKIWKLWLYHHPSDILHLSKRTIIRISPPPLLSGKWNLKMKILIKNLISNLEDQLLALMMFFSLRNHTQFWFKEAVGFPCLHIIVLNPNPLSAHYSGTLCASQLKSKVRGSHGSLWKEWSLMPLLGLQLGLKP